MVIDLSRASRARTSDAVSIGWRRQEAPVSEGLAVREKPTKILIDSPRTTRGYDSISPLVKLTWQLRIYQFANDLLVINQVYACK